MKPLPSRPDPSLTERTPQEREEREPIFKYPVWIQVSLEVLADTARTWQERSVILGSSDPNPFPPFRLFRWLP